MARASSWTNPDGLIVGFGPNTPQLTGEGTEHNVAGAKVAATTFTWQDLNAGRTINVPIPAGTRVLDVKIKVDTTFTSTGSNTIEVGDGSDPDGFITAAVAATANLVAGAEIYPSGVYVLGATDTVAAELKIYTAADTIDLTSAMTDWTAGKASLVVTYL